ncbi:hypothetical protein LSTR_LSTR014430 [Laodelphax striatellus]|uniref:Uncharacterized protein n=1 Tax=Laodelphax striatellus TaxID=195883 RepID=A0A482WLA4_LAOST|nr:hypothetical protein LSTR_LSTR014430 [Laodelphax striatellus]
MYKVASEQKEGEKYGLGEAICGLAAADRVYGGWQVTLVMGWTCSPSRGADNARVPFENSATQMTNSISLSLSLFLFPFPSLKAACLYYRRFLFIVIVPVILGVETVPRIFATVKASDTRLWIQREASIVETKKRAAQLSMRDFGGDQVKPGRVVWCLGSSEDGGEIEVENESGEDEVDLQLEQERDEKDRERARGSLPKELELRGGGVWTRSPLAERSRYGPFLGKWLNKPLDHRFAWTVPA